MAPGLDLHPEQHMQAPQHDGIDMQESHAKMPGNRVTWPELGYAAW
jgi:hypothetical protein